MVTYKRHRYPPQIISHAIWLYFRFSLSFRDVQELLAQRGISVTYEAIRAWTLKFGPPLTQTLKKRNYRKGDKWHVDEMCVMINKQCYWLFRAVDKDGFELDVMLQARRNKKAVTRFFSKVLNSQSKTPRVIVKDKLLSYRKPCKFMMPKADHRRHKLLNNRIENSHKPSRIREKNMVKFKSPRQAQHFLSLYGQVRNLFFIGRYKSPAAYRRSALQRAFSVWDEVTLQEDCA